MNHRIFLTLILALTFSLASILYAQPQIELIPFATGISSPTDITHAGDNRLFVVSKQGRIHIVDDQGAVHPRPFLDIDPLVNSVASERGLLGLAFPPDYSSSGVFYVNYTDNNGNTVVSRFSVTADPDSADASSEQVVLAINQPFSNHNGGDLAFGPDGFLYIPTGDGGSGNDPQNYAQNRLHLLGKILRIDVSNSTTYTIPPGNPFVSDPSALDEIWAMGLRNPWRASFDRTTGDLWIGDVGQNAFEEISRQPANSAGGENYGWRCYEGFNAHLTTNCLPASNFTDPVHAYDNTFSVGHSVTGGYVYRGSQYPLLFGHYIFGDYVTGRLWSLFPNTSGQYESTLHGKLLGNSELSTFGEDVNGEIYVGALSSGQIYKVTEKCSAVLPSISVSNDTLFAIATTTNYQWYLNGSPISGATGSFYVPMVSGSYAVQIETDNGCGFLRSAPLAVVGLDGLPELPVTIAPNPMTGSTEIQFPNPSRDPYVLILTDLKGRQVLRVGEIREERFTLKRANLAPGIYLIHLKGVKQFVGKLLIE